MIKITTRPAGESDHPSLRSIYLISLRDTITATRGNWDESRESKQFDEELELPGTKVIQTDGKDVGYIMCRDLKSDVEIHTICISPEYQGQGIGSYVIAVVLNEARQRGCGVSISVLKTNDGARRLYARLGFAMVGESKNHFHMKHSKLDVPRCDV